jgi:N-acyl-phosphatidylethanolamine-hydrolysing phospholipase D
MASGLAKVIRTERYMISRITVKIGRFSTVRGGLALMFVLVLGFGIQACATGGETQVAGKPWHHVEGGFRNPPGSPPRTAKLFSDFIPFLARRIVIGGPDPIVPPGHSLDEQTALAGFASQASQAEAHSVTWLGHAAFLVRMGGKTVLTDPFLTDRASPVDWFGPVRYVPPAISIPNLPAIDAIIVSHNHYDHLDHRTIEALPNKDQITVFAPLGIGDFFRARGYTQVHDLDWYQSKQLDGLIVTGVPAVHFCRRGMTDFNEVLWGGYVLEADGRRVYFAGDTGYGEVFKEIGEKFAPIQTALIPIGAYEPRSIMKPSHVTPEEAVQLGQDIGAETMVGMHWGTIVLTDEPQLEAPDRFRAAARAAGYADEAAWVLKIGETRSLPHLKQSASTSGGGQINVE